MTSNRTRTREVSEPNGMLCSCQHLPKADCASPSGLLCFSYITLLIVGELFSCRGSEFLWERVVVKYETLLTLSGRVEYVRKQLISI